MTKFLLAPAFVAMTLSAYAAGDGQTHAGIGAVATCSGSAGTVTTSPTVIERGGKITLTAPAGTNYAWACVCGVFEPMYIPGEQTLTLTFDRTGAYFLWYSVLYTDPSGCRWFATAKVYVTVVATIPALSPAVVMLLVLGLGAVGVGSLTAR